jgi:hypothetical protein
VPLAERLINQIKTGLNFALQIVCALGYLSISYWMTGQPMELSRMLPFFVLCVLTSLTAQAFGFFIGATLPVTVSLFSHFICINVCAAA